MGHNSVGQGCSTPWKELRTVQTHITIPTMYTSISKVIQPEQNNVPSTLPKHTQASHYFWVILYFNHAQEVPRDLACQASVDPVHMASATLAAAPVGPSPTSPAPTRPAPSPAGVNPVPVSPSPVGPVPVNPVP